MNRVFYLTTVIVIFICIDLRGQNRTITGRIIDEHLNPLSGAVVQTLDSTFTARADKNGHYVLTVPNGTKRIKAWSIGMETDTFKIPDNCNFNIILLDDIIAEFETVKEHKKRYKKRKRELPKLYNEAVRKGIFDESKPCS